MKLTIHLITVGFILLMTSNCSSHISSDKLHTITEIIEHASNGQGVKSQGVLSARSAKREFIVRDQKSFIAVNFGEFKKESKYLKENTKIIFSGKYRKSLFSEPKIEIESLLVVDEFR